MAAVVKDREEEEAFFQSAQPPTLPQDVIRKVHFQLDKDGDFLLLFETGTRRYGLVVVFANRAELGWKECHALADAMRIAARGTTISNDAFLSLVPQLQQKYARVDGPLVHSGHLLAVLYPTPGTINTDRPHTILHIGLSVDSDGDLVFRASTSEDLVYTICLELTAGYKFMNLDCKAFVDIVSLLEPGDVLDPVSFVAAGAVLRTKYNYVSISATNGGRAISLSILASRVENNEPLDPAFVDALTRLAAQTASSSDAETAASPALRCPYPGITYTKALKESGQAQVYAGRRGDDRVAVKVFLTEDGEEGATAAYKTELRMLLKMSRHPNVVEVLDFFETPSPALVMRLIEGEDLMDYIRAHGRSSESEGRRLAVGIAKGLCHLHRHGIIHRDLKTLNVLRQADGTPIVIDLGLSSVLERKAKPNVEMTLEQLCSSMASTHLSDKTEAFKGSFPWMPPEMITEQVWSEKTDVYAFGIVMWEIFSGKKPFVRDNGERLAPITLLMRIAGGERPPISAVSHISSDLRSLIQACWHAEPKRRPSMKRVLDLLNGNDPREIFASIDSNKSGTLDFGEFVMFLQRYAPRQVDPGQMHALFEAIDADRSGEISVGEFEAFWRQVEMGGLSAAIANCKGKKVHRVRVY